MLHILLILIVIGECLSIIIPSQGEVWPKPFYEKKQNEKFKVDLRHLKFKVTKPCKIVTKAIHRCQRNIEILEDIVRKYSLLEELSATKHKKLNTLELELIGPCGDDEYPYFGMDESYNLTISTSSILSSATVWGLIRGLETFTQLCYIDQSYKNILIKATIIEDRPHYPYRGYMLDTSRHYVSKENILKGLEAMAMDKMNVFHWHITDDQSFPYQSENHPELSKKGAFFRTMIYSQSDVKTIVEFARDRGIRVIPEFDVPSHATSWGKSHPELVLKKCVTSTTGALNPTINGTYKLLQELFDEIAKVFPDDYIHLGSDEPDFDCWLKDEDIKLFLKEHNIEDVKKVYAYFFQRIYQILRNKTPVVWEEAFTNEAPLLPETIVEVWNANDHPMNTTKNVLNAGYYAVLAEGFYLDHLNNNFEDVYENEPRLRAKSVVNNDKLLENLVGGETCMWGERMDDSNMISRSWPRTSAAAEVLWSVTKGSIPKDVWPRIQEHWCMMTRRGIHVSPFGPGFCVT